MAFSGLPSKACANCRIRRIKCNQLEPACSQCRRAGKICPGYRDQLDLIFRDENAKVIRKARSAPHREAERPGERQRARRVEASSREPFDIALISQHTDGYDTLAEGAQRSITRSPPSSESLSSIQSSLRLSPEDQGLRFFFSHYVTLWPAGHQAPDNPSWPLIQEVTSSRPFIDAVCSVGLAGLSNVNGDRQMMKIARLKYQATLHRIMGALQDPRRSDLSFTFKAVMMLAMFEVVNCTPKSSGMWGVHIDGAVALLNAVVLQKNQSYIEIRMKVQFGFSIFINYLQRGIKCPPAMAQWSRLWGNSLAEEDLPVAPLADIIRDFVDLYASIQDGSQTNSAAIIAKAQSMDAALVKWSTNLPENWNYTTGIMTGHNDGTFNGKYHVYRDRWIGRMWDQYRWTRIVVNEIMLKYISQPPATIFRHLTQVYKSINLVSTLSSDICASVASQLSRSPLGGSTSSTSPQMSGVFMTLWPLKIAGGAVGVPEALYLWVIAVLERIGTTMGIMQTGMVIRVTTEQRERWKERVQGRMGAFLLTR